MSGSKRGGQGEEGLRPGAEGDDQPAALFPQLGQQPGEDGRGLAGAGGADDDGHELALVEGVVQFAR